MFLKVQKALLGLMFLAAFSPTTAYADDEIRIDLPAGGQLKVRNDFGDVTAEVWSNSHVAVSAVIGGDGSTRLSRSPIIIDNRGSLITISVVRRPTDPVVPIHLKIKVPDNAEITARSQRGTIKSSLERTPPTDNQPFQARVGNGDRKIDIQTQAGAIVLGYMSRPEIATTDSPPAKEPELLGANGPKRASGTPSEPVNTSDEISEGDVIRVDSQLVTLNISVIDRSTNRGLLGLAQSDFKLFEDGQEQRIVQFDSSSAPFDLMLVIDLSGSTKDVIKLIRAAAIRFVDAARPADRIGVITFAGEAKVISELTADRELLRQRIETIDTARGDTKLYDATNFAMDELLKESKKSRRSAIVLMSDGLDGTIPGVNGQQGSRKSYPETLRNIQEFDGVLYTLWLNTEYQAMSPDDTQPEAFDAGHDRMKEMADAGGGVFYEVERLTDLAGAYEQVVADLGTMYSLAYRPANSARDGKWRAIRIGVSRTNAVPRGKRGYYAN
ncbi:MAG TPA: VWA domain-containing protein [Pyrinomonadaceae bacterium]|nr:VWA domain-containing protein [Pyrinomonadaceae bacterium]